MEKILIIGGNGSGKTTFAKELSRKLNIPVIHLDKLYWKDNWQHASPDEFDEKLMAELVKDTWIIDGNMKRTLPLRLKHCDTVFVFDFLRVMCMLGAIKRTFQNYGKSRNDMGGYCPEKISLSFYKSIWKGTKNTMANFYKAIKEEPALNIIIFKKRKDVRDFLSKI